MLKLGCVPYINALPLTYGLDPQEVELLHRPPSELLDLLKSGQVEAALLPIVNYFENPDLYLVPGLAIACRGPVKSVRLYLNQNPPVSPFEKGGLKGDLKTIYLDPESRTSHALLKVILKHKYKINLENIQFTSDLSNPDIQAKLLIGDKTLTSPLPPPYQGGGIGGRSLDLGEEWWSWQKKPFVFAAWISLNPKTPLANLLQESKNQGLQNIDKIIAKERGTDRLSLKDYFTKNIHYTMEDPELDGIRRFYELLKPIQKYHHELDFKFVS